MTEVLFRVDGGDGVGMGHLMEMLHLADVFHRSYPISPLFAVSKDETAKNIIHREGEEFIDLPEGESEISFLKQISESRSLEKIIVNLPQASDSYLRALKNSGFYIVNLVEGIKDAISDEVIDFSENPDLMILNPVFAQKGRTKEIRREIESILVCFGANDPLGLTLRLSGLFSGQFPDTRINVITGISFRCFDELRRLQSRSSNIALFHDISIEKVAQVMFESSLAVTAGGDMMYELVTVGTPAIVLPPSGRQIRTSRSFQEQGLVHSLGLHTEVPDSAIIEAVMGLWKDFDRRKRVSEQGRKLMDGSGASRVAEKLGKSWQINSARGGSAFFAKDESDSGGG